MTDGQIDRQTDGLINMNSQGLPANAGIQKVFKKNTKIIDKSRKKWIIQKLNLYYLILSHG